MNLTELPLEIFIMIIQKLDTKSVYNTYNSCRVLRSRVQGTVKECNFSMNTLATVEAFRTLFFNDIAEKLQVLNLSGAPDLRKRPLKAGMRKLKNLKTLDISYTNLNLLDFLELYKICPTIDSISLNFMIKQKGLTQLKPEEINACQNAFKNCRNVNFIGSATNLLYSKLSLLLLKEADLDTLKFTIAENDRLHTMYVPAACEGIEMAKFKQFYLSFLDWTTRYAFYGSFFRLPVLSMIDLKTIEAIIIISQNLQTREIHSTPLFGNFFEDSYDIEAGKELGTDCSDIITGNATIMIWDKKSHKFDEYFFCKLGKKVKPYFPWDCTLSKEGPVPDKHDWFYLSPQQPGMPGASAAETRHRHKRRAPPDIVLDYDTLFEQKHRLKLSVFYDNFIINPLTLSPNSTYLGKLTFLSLTGNGSGVRYTSEFFKLLFKCCIHLETLNVEATKINHCSKNIANYIHQSPTLKNFRLTDRQINFDVLIVSLSKCKTLENVYIKEESFDKVVCIEDPSIIIKECPNLYNIYIEGLMTEAARKRHEQRMAKAKMKLRKHHLNLKVHVKEGVNKMLYSYDPFISVFNLNPLKQVE